MKKRYRLYQNLAGTEVLETFKLNRRKSLLGTHQGSVQKQSTIKEAEYMSKPSIAERTVAGRKLE